MRNTHFGRVVGLLALFSTIFGCGTASAADTQPGDFVPAPPGTSAALLYGIFGQNTGATISGQDLDASLQSLVVMPRLVHYFDVGGFTADVNVLLPMGSLWDGKLGNTWLPPNSGTGDLTFVGTLWLINQPKEERYLAVAGYLSVPTGGYDPLEPLNLGTNRFSWTFQVGAIYGLSEHWRIESVTDATFFGDNENANAAGATLSKDLAFSQQIWLTYKATQTLNLSVGYAYYGGGTETLAGVETGFNSEKQQVRAAASLWVTPTVQVLAQANHDFEVKGGFEQAFSGLLRVMTVF